MIDSNSANIISTDLQVNQYGLLEVSFNCVGKLQYPTTLRAGADSIYTDAKFAFRNGSATTKMLPKFNYTNGTQVWSCSSLLFQDGSAYFPTEDARDITDTDKRRIFAAHTKIDNEFSLLYVTFSGVGLIGDKPIYPTSLNSNYTIDNNPIDAFWGGEESVNLPSQWQKPSDQIGCVWETTTVLNLDGSAISDDEETLLCEYVDIASVNIVGAVNIDGDRGVRLSPPIEHKIKAQVTLKLLPEAVQGDSINIPYHAKAWADTGCAGTMANGAIVSDQNGCRGYLVDDVASIMTTFKGSDIKPNTVFSVWGYSTPTYDEYMSNIYTSLIDCSVRVLFTSITGTVYYLYKEVVGLGDE